MASEAYLSIKGVKQGQFNGEGTNNKRKDKWVAVLSFGYGVESPRDAATGQATGKRTHKPIVITKEWGAASPQIWQALATNEILSEVQIQFTRPGGNGSEEVYQTITLTNAQISSFKAYTGAVPPSAPKGKKYESLSIVYVGKLVVGIGGPLPHIGVIERFGSWG